MLRATVGEEGQQPLPSVDVDDAVVVIGSGPAARIRLPASPVRTTVPVRAPAARLDGGGASAILPEHVRVEAGRWRALGEVRVGGAVATGGAIGEGVELAIASYRVRLAPAPAGVAPAPPQRTESLARELLRSLLGDAAAPALELVRGPGSPSKRTLPPPESRLVIGRGDEATWIILDNDLSRVHAEIRRGWDGTRIVDLDSKNGTLVDGTRITDAPLHDGAEIELGKIAFRFHDAADRQLRGRAPTIAIAPAPSARSRAPFYAALAIMVLAAAGLAWVLAS